MDDPKINDYVLNLASEIQCLLDYRLKLSKHNKDSSSYRVNGAARHPRGLGGVHCKHAAI